MRRNICFLCLSALLFPASLLNAGTLFSKTDFQLPATEGFVADVVPFDFDGNGDIDFIVNNFKWPVPVNNSEIAFTFVKNLGGGNFSVVMDSWATQIKMISPRDWDINDFNKDGRTDLIFAEQGDDNDPWPGGQSKIVIRTPDGKLSDETSSRFPQINIFTHSITSGDINKDGSPDIYMGNVFGQNKEGPFFYINNGTGVFAKDKARIPTAISDISTQKFTASKLADMDNDGDLDLILGRDGDILTKDMSINFNKDVLLLNNGNGFFSPVSDSAMPNRAGAKENSVVDICVEDFNNDGKNDILFSTTFKYQTTELQLLINNGNNTFIDKSNNIPQSWPNNAWIRKTISGDFNNDGEMDFLAVGNGQAPTKLYYNTGDAVFEDVTGAAGLDASLDVGWSVSDFTGDEWLDILVVRHDKSSSLFTNTQGVQPLALAPILLLLKNN